jgi:hypothetical protein
MDAAAREKRVGRVEALKEEAAQDAIGIGKASKAAKRQLTVTGRDTGTGRGTGTRLGFTAPPAHDYRTTPETPHGNSHLLGLTRAPQLEWPYHSWTTDWLVAMHFSRGARRGESVGPRRSP